MEEDDRTLFTALDIITTPTQPSKAETGREAPAGWESS